MNTAIKGFYYKTKSRFNGKPLVVIFTGFTVKSLNKKLGADFIQSWILLDKVNPYSAAKNRKDYANCGPCKQRRNLKGHCYVNTAYAPSNIYKAYKRNNYTELDLENPKHLKLFKDKSLRIGAYGDPVAVDILLWQTLLKQTDKYTGYTHTWNLESNQEYKQFLMASVDNIEEYHKARSLGWRTFRAIFTKEENIKLPREFICPASKEENYRLNCGKCFACNGNKKESAATVNIIIHGVKARPILKSFEV